MDIELSTVRQPESLFAANYYVAHSHVAVEKMGHPFWRERSSETPKPDDSGCTCIALMFTPTLKKIFEDMHDFLMFFSSAKSVYTVLYVYTI